MATFKAEVQNKRADGTYNVRIRVTHNRDIRRISTNLFVTDVDLTRGLKIKNTKVIAQCDDLLNQCRTLCNSFGYAIDAMHVDALTEKLKSHLRGGERFTLDFIKYMKDKAAGMKKSTGGLYLTTANTLIRFTKNNSLDIAEINTDFLSSFETFIEAEPSQRGNNRKGIAEAKAKGGRAVSMYLSRIRAMHNLAKKEYNDEDRGVIRIPYSPFKKFKIKPEPKTRKRALTVKQIQDIINLPYNGIKRHDLAKDCFIISFVLIGMNSADMYHAGPLKKNLLIYNRLKTADRRDDSAEMRVKVDTCISQLMAKYKDNKRLFNFHRSYADTATFNTALNIGLKKIGEEIGVEDLEFYAARHSWATIARSSLVGIDKATVHEALNHVDEDMKVTDIYIDKDWSVIWNANKKVLALFDWSAVGLDLL